MITKKIEINIEENLYEQCKIYLDIDNKDIDIQIDRLVNCYLNKYYEKINKFD